MPWPQIIVFVILAIWIWKIGNRIHETSFSAIERRVRGGVFLATIVALQLALRARGFW